MPLITLPSLLADLIPVGVFIGVSLIIPGRAGFLLGGRPLRLTVDGPVVELTGIGGGLLPADSSLTAAARREAAEEIGCDVRLLPSASTVVVRGPGQPETVTVSGSEMPAAIVFRGYRTPPHAPWHHAHRGDTCLVVFLAELLGCPRPSSELPLLAWLDADTLCASARSDMAFTCLPGALALLSAASCPPANALVRLTDSQEALVLALGAQAVSFYRNIADEFS